MRRVGWVATAGDIVLTLYVILETVLRSSSRYYPLCLGGRWYVGILDSSEDLLLSDEQNVSFSSLSLRGGRRDVQPSVGETGFFHSLKAMSPFLPAIRSLQLRGLSAGLRWH
jgi:hypothetical protein